MNQKERFKAKVRARQIKVLAFIRKNGKATPHQLVEHLNIKAHQIAGIVGQLVKNGEIVGVDSGARTRNGNTILDYYLAGDPGHPPCTADIEEAFPLAQCFPAWFPQTVPYTGTARQHICKA